MNPRPGGGGCRDARRRGRTDAAPNPRFRLGAAGARVRPPPWPAQRGQLSPAAGGSGRPCGGGEMLPSCAICEG